MLSKAHRYLVGTALMLASSLAAGEVRADDWWGADKAMHLGVGLGLGVGAYGGLRLLDVSNSEARPVRLGLACFMASLPGLAKELYDAGQPGNIFSGKDLLWSTLGAVVGGGIVLGLELLLERVFGIPRVARVGRGPRILS
jgi:uncharacterized protein YfiM (DUF2279 family)